MWSGKILSEGILQTEAVPPLMMARDRQAVGGPGGVWERPEVLGASGPHQSTGHTQRKMLPIRDDSLVTKEAYAGRQAVVDLIS